MSDLIDQKILLEFMNRLETKFDGLYSKLEERNEANYRRLEETMDANYDTLNKRLSDWISKTDNTFDGLKDKVQDHEFRIRNMESARKEQIDRIFRSFGQFSESGSFTPIKPPSPEETSAIKKLLNNPNTGYVALAIAIMIFLSGNFEPIYKIVGLIVGKP